MESRKLSEIKIKLEELYVVLYEISHSKDLEIHPFDSNIEYSLDILDTIQKVISKATQKKDQLIKENAELENKINEYSTELSINIAEPPLIENLPLRNEFLKNELEKILLIRNKLENEIKVIIEAITSLSLELDIQTPCNYVVSYDCLNKLKNIKIDLENKLNEMESKRQYFYEQIAFYNEKLFRETNFTFEENITELKKVSELLKKDYLEKDQQLKNYLDEIKKKEALLNLKHKEFKLSLDNDNFALIEQYIEFLKGEQTRLFDEIYDRTLTELKKVNEVLGRQDKDYNRDEVSLSEMRETLEKYLNVIEKYNEIVEQIEKRKSLLVKMTEFEKIASDPKRLFKSSFQLNSEEKFRNNAYPSLLKIEEDILEAIDTFENDFGVFYFEGQPHKSALKHEIENRIINRTVFIRRCDSPYRKKK